MALVFKAFGARFQNSQLILKIFRVLMVKRHNTETRKTLAVVLLAMSMFFNECVTGGC